MGVWMNGVLPTLHHKLALPPSFDELRYFPDSRLVLPYDCGHCGMSVGGRVVCYQVFPLVIWLRCPNPDCSNGSVWNDEGLYPPPLSSSRTYTANVDGLPDNIAQVYHEARKAISVQMYTSCEVLCRKILVIVAVDKGAKKKDTWNHKKCIRYLVKKGYIDGMLTRMASYVRLTGDQSTHEMWSPSLERAEQTLKFTAMVLSDVYDAEREIVEPKEPTLSNEYRLADEFQLLDYTKHSTAPSSTTTTSVAVLQVSDRIVIYVKNDGRLPSKTKMKTSIQAWLRQVPKC